jgi:hypothetical protein
LLSQMFRPSGFGQVDAREPCERRAVKLDLGAFDLAGDSEG